MATKRETLRLLCKSIINRLENRKAITFPARLRQIVQDEIFGLIGPLVLTEEDLRNRALAKVGAKAEALEDAAYTENEQFKAAKAVVRNSLGGDELNGFYYQKAPKVVANEIVLYMMRSSHIDDVYETDEDLEHQILEVLRTFDPKQVH